MCLCSFNDAAPDVSFPQMLCLRTTVSNVLYRLGGLSSHIFLLKIQMMRVRGCIFDENLAGQCDEFIVSFVRHDDLGM
jgi:hypothetical protein